MSSSIYIHQIQELGKQYHESTGKVILYQHLDEDYCSLMTELENALQSSEMQPWADLTFSKVSDNVYLHSSNIPRFLRWKSRVAVGICFEARER